MAKIIKARPFSLQRLILKTSKKKAMLWLPDMNIYYIGDYPSAVLIMHELIHVKQVERYGKVKYMELFLWYNIKYGYKNNPLELEAWEGLR